MKNIIIPVTLLLFIIYKPTFCQDIKKLERLDAIKTNGAIYIIDFTSTSKKYVTNDKTPITEASNFEAKKLNYFRTDNNNINILMPFYNPLQYNLKIYTSYSDDPSTKTYNEFMVAFSKTFESVLPQLETEPSPSEIAQFDLAMTKNGFQKNQKKEFSVVVNSVLLRDWVYQAMVSSYLKNTNLKELSESIQTVENFLLDKVDIKDEDKSVDDWIKNESKQLFDQTTIAGFEKELGEADEILTKLKELEKTAVTSKATVSKLVENQPDAKKSDGSIDLAFQNYSKSTAHYFELTVKPLFDQRKEKLLQFESFLKKLRKDYTDTYKNTKQTFSPLELADVANIAMQDEKDLTITIGLRKIDENGKKTADTLGIVFTVIHQNKLNIVPDISAGLVFFNGGLEYKAYSLKDDLISEETKTKQFQPVVFLNFYSHISGKLYLVLPQIGVTNATDFPALLVGGGLTVLNRFSFSAGIPISFAQKLKDGKKPGDALAQGKTLGESTSFTWNDNFPAYFSLSYRIGKE